MGGPGQQGAAKKRVLEEGIDNSGPHSRHSGWASSSPAERQVKAGSCSWLLLGLQESCFACKHEALCGFQVQCPAPLGGMLPPLFFLLCLLLLSALQGWEQFGQDCFQ